MKKIYRISELNSTIQGVISSSLGVVMIEGEISNFVCAASGHYYFALKDNHAQIRCVMFKSKNKYLDHVPLNGDAVLVRALVTVYETRGDLQLIVENIEPVGMGILLLKIEKLKQKIISKGMTDKLNKKSLPKYPNKIGIISSPTGAAIQDAIKVITHYLKSCHIIIYPTLVQGEKASDNLLKVIKLANLRQEVDLLLLIRGGGSVEDLAVFNDEDVLNAVYNSKLPIISGIGHETDNTLVDLVADYAAPTPSVAAEISIREIPEGLKNFEILKSRLVKALSLINQNQKYHLKHLESKFKNLHPKNRILNFQQKCDYLAENLKYFYNAKILHKNNKYREIKMKLDSKILTNRIINNKENVKLTIQKIYNTAQVLLNNKQHLLTNLTQKIRTLDPKENLRRGYTITLDENGKNIADLKKIRNNSTLKTISYNGYIKSKITKIIKNNP